MSNKQQTRKRENMFGACPTSLRECSKFIPMGGRIGTLLRSKLAMLAMLTTPLFVSPTLAPAETGTPVIAIDAVQSSVIEGSAIVFRISSTPAPTGDGVQVELDSNLSGDFGIQYNSTVTLTPEHPTAVVAVRTEDDNQIEENGGITLSIRQSSDPAAYLVAELPNNTASVRILDNDGDANNLATISIKPVIDFVEEGGPAQFAIYSDLPTGELVELKVAQSGDYIDGYFDCYTVEMASGATSASLSIITVDDLVHEEDGLITVSIVPSENFVISETGDSASIAVLDNDAEGSRSTLATDSNLLQSVEVPEISIKAISPNPLVEGGVAGFILTSSKAPVNNLSIAVSIYEQGTDHYREAEIRQTVLLASTVSEPITLNAQDDDLADGNGRITLTVLPGLGYTVAPSNQVEIATLDNDGNPANRGNADFGTDLPEISLAALNNVPIQEGRAANFQLTSSKTSETDLLINVFATDHGNEFLQTASLEPVLLPAGQRRIAIELETDDDDLAEPDGAVLAAILSGDGYRIGRSVGDVVEILDNDSVNTNAAIFGCGETFDTVNQGATPIIEIDTVPFSRIGNLVEFRIQASVVVETDMTVNLQLNGSDKSGEYSVSISIPLLRGEQITSFFFPAGSDSSSDNRGTISARVASGNNYTVNETRRPATTELIDVDSTNVVSIRALTNSVIEGSPANFQLRSTAAQSQPFEVWVEFTERQGNTIAGTSIEQFVMPAGWTEFPIDLITAIDDEYFGDTEIIATVLVGPNYRASGAPGNRAKITAQNDGVAVVSVAADRESGSEGDRFEFELTANPAPDGNLEVNYEFQQEGDFLDANGSDIGVGNSTAAFSSRNGRLSYTALTVDDLDLENDGYLTLSVLPGSGYRIAPGESGSVTVKVEDDDAPRLSLNSVTFAPPVEGEQIRFELVSSRSAPTEMVINMEVRDGESSFIVNSANPAYFPSGGQRVQFTVPTVDDETDEEDDWVTVVLLPGPGYNVAAAAQVAAVQVVDNDEPRMISITAANESLTEGEPAKFRIEADGSTTREIAIQVETVIGDFLNEEELPTSVVFESGQSVDLELETIDDNVDEIDGSVVVTIMAGEGYTVSEDNAIAVVEVKDNDAISAISIANTEQLEIVEGEEAQFILTATQAAFRTVNISVDDGEADYIDEEEQVIRVELAGLLEQVVTIQTRDNGLDDAGGYLTVTILEGEGYEVTEPPADSASVIVNNNFSPPEVTISTAASSVTEGSTIRFEIESTKPIKEEIAVEVATIGDYVRGSVPLTLTLETRNTMELNIETEDDQVDERNGSVEVTLVENAASDYIVGEQKSAVVEIVDNDVPVLSISTNQQFVQEGESVIVTTTSASPLVENLNVRVRFTDRGETINREKFVTVSMAAGSETSFEIPYVAVRNEEFQFDRWVQSEIVTAKEYTVDKDKSTAVRVIGVSTPVVTIEPLSTVVVEAGNNLSFVLRSSFALARPLQIEVGIVADGEIAVSTPTQTVVLPAGEEEVVFQVFVEDNGLSTQNGKVTVRILDDPGYVREDGDANRIASIGVSRPEARAGSVISISAVNEEVAEGSPVQFRLTAVPVPEAELEIIVIVGETRDFLTRSEGPLTVTMEAGDAGTTFSIGTSSEATVNLDGVVTAEVDAGEGYQVAPVPDNIARVSVVDDTQPVVAITAATNQIQEGNPARFNISTSQVADYPMTVTVRINGAPDFLENATEVREVAFAAFSESQEVSVNTVEDLVDEPNGTITATLQSAPSYLIESAETQSASIDVEDDDIPVISLAVVGQSVQEGSPIQFSLTSSLISAMNLEINVNVSGGGGYLDDGVTGVAVRTLPARQQSETFEIPTLDNDTNDSDAEVTLELRTGTGYQTATTPVVPTTVTIRDNDLPLITIGRVEQVVVEGSPIQFTLSAAPASINELSIGVAVSGATSFIDSGDIGTALHTLAAGESTKTYEIDTVQDEADEIDGTITLTLQSGTGYRIPTAVSEQSTSFNLQDDDTPEISISRGAQIVEEGNPIQFTLSASTAPAIALDIGVQVTGATNFINMTSGSVVTQRLAAQQSSANYEIATIANGADDQDGTITLTVQSGTGYTVTTVLSDQSTSFTIQDDATVVISITPGPLEVTEGSNIQFTLTASIVPATNLDINVNVSGDTDFINSADAGTKARRLPANDMQLPVTIATLDNSSDNLNGTITVKVESGTGYDVDSENTKVFTIVDDETPLVSIGRVAQNVTEGGTIQFTLTPSIAPVNALDVKVNVTGATNFIASSNAGVITRQLPAASTIATTFDIATVQDNVDEANGTISMEVQDGTGYAPVTTLAKSTSFNLTDDDTPLVSIGRVAQNVTEGGTIQFTLTPSIAPVIALNVKVNVTGAINFIASSNAGVITRELPAGATAAKTFDIATVNDSVDEVDGVISMTVQDGTGYAPIETLAKSTSFNLSDNDTPLVSIGRVAQNVAEGGTIQFTLTPSIAPAVVLTVNVNVTGATSFIASSNAGVITRQLPAGATTATTFDIATIDDMLDELDGTITMTVQDGTGYDPVTTLAKSTSFSLTDNDIPQISIERVNATITEGQNIQFKLRASSTPAVALSVNVNMTGTAESLNFIKNTGDKGVSIRSFATTNSVFTYSIETLNPATNDRDGTITLTVQSGTNYEPLTTTDKHIAVFTIEDDDTPTLSIHAVTGTGDATTEITSVNEGETITFELRTSVTSYKALSATVTPLYTPWTYYGVGTSQETYMERTDQYVSATDLTNSTRQIPAGSSAVRFTISTTHLTAGHKPDKDLTMDISDNTSTDYLINSMEDSPHPATATVTIKNKVFPTITVKFKEQMTQSQPDGKYLFGRTGADEFILESSIFLNAHLSVKVNVTEETDTEGFLPDNKTGDRTVNFTNTLTWTESIGLMDPGTPGNTSTVIIKVLDGDGYVAAAADANGTVTIPVALRDDGLSASPPVLDRIDGGITDGTTIETPTDPDLSLPVVTIAAETETVVEGESAQFNFTADAELTEDLDISIAVDQGEITIVEGALPRAVTLKSGQSGGILLLPTVNDSVVQEDAIVTVKILAGNGYRIGTGSTTTASIEVLDNEAIERIERLQAVNNENIPEMLTTMGTALVASFTERFDATQPGAEAPNPVINFGGQNTILDVLQYKAQELGENTNSWVSLLEDANILQPLFTDGDLLLPTTVWGHGDYRYLTESDEDAANSRNGEVYNASIGFDVLLDSGILGGVSVNHFASNLEYETSGEQSVLGRHQNQMNGLQPYLGWISPEQRVRVWTSAGFGQGTIDYEIADVETLSVQTSHYVVAMGGSNRLYQSDEFLGGTGEVDLRSEAWTIQQDVDGSSIGIGNAQFNSNRIRVIAEAIHLARYSEESGIEAAASGGGRWDSDSMGNEFSIEVGSDLTYEIPHGFTVSGDALVLVGDAITVDHQSLRGTLQYDDLHDSLGFLAEVTSSIGDPKQGRDNARDLWQIDFSEDRDDLTVSEDDRQFEFELGYGYQIFDRRGVTTPYNRVVLRQQGRHEFRIGNRMLVGPKFSSDVEGFFSLEEKENEVGFSNSYKFSW